MTIDERIEALTQSVELMAHMHGDHERRMEELQQMMERIVTVQEMMAQILNGHERRLRDLERGE